MDITGATQLRQQLAIIGLKSQLDSQRTLATVVGDALAGMKAAVAAAPPPERGGTIDIAV